MISAAAGMMVRYRCDVTDRGAADSRLSGTGNFAADLLLLIQQIHHFENAFWNQYVLLLEDMQLSITTCHVGLLPEARTQKNT